jgi:hypothetical protein
MANMSAAEMLKAEMGGVKPDLSLPPKPVAVEMLPTVSGIEAVPMSIEAHDDEVPGLGTQISALPLASNQVINDATPTQGDTDVDLDADGETDPDVSNGTINVVAGVKRKHEEDEDDESLGSEEEGPPDAGPSALKVNKDGTVEQEDKVKYVIPRTPEYAHRG